MTRTLAFPFRSLRLTMASACAPGIGLLMGISAAGGATLKDISFVSNGSQFINDTIVNSTSPLVFTLTSGLDQPFLNAADSTIILGYGTFYAISFLGFGAHVGEGTVSFRVDDGPLIFQNVVFPNPASSGVVFANIPLSGGESVVISTTGLSADRIRIVANGDGMTTDGTPDAFYLFTYSPVPEPGVVSFLPLALLLATGRRRIS